MKVEELREKFGQVWDVTKSDIDKALDETAKLLKKGEEYFKEISGKSRDNLELVSLKVRREKLYYQLGKALSRLPAGKWAGNKKVKATLDEIKTLTQRMNKSKRRKKSGPVKGK